MYGSLTAVKCSQLVVPLFLSVYTIALSPPFVLLTFKFRTCAECYIFSQFDKLADQLLDLPMESLRMLRILVQAVFDKALDEPNFVDMYADLCVRLNERSSSWSFVKVRKAKDISVCCHERRIMNGTWMHERILAVAVPCYAVVLCCVRIVICLRKRRSYLHMVHVVSSFLTCISLLY